MVIKAKSLKANQENAYEVQIVRLGVREPVNMGFTLGYTIEEVIDELPDEVRRGFYKEDGTHAYEYRDERGNPINVNSEIPEPSSGNQTRLIASKMLKAN
jgi:hypothetical protein